MTKREMKKEGELPEIRKRAGREGQGGGGSNWGENK